MFLALLILSCFGSCRAASSQGTKHDETLPVVNVQYDFPAMDTSSGGALAKQHQDIVAFKKRAEQLIQRSDRDGEAMAEFVGLATEGLDKLMSAFQRASRLSPMLTSSNAKAMQFLQVAHENVQSMMPLAPLALPQPVWQAGEPISVNVDFDVPAHGAQDELAKLRQASELEKKVFERERLLSSMTEGLELQQEKPKATSFLSSRVLPVDAFKLRNSLFLTQPLRSPAAAAINIVEHEDVSKLKDKAKYQAMENQISRLQEEFEKSLAAMKS